METYDRSTGQIYTEDTVAVQSMIEPEIRGCRGKLVDPRKYRNPGPGVASLRDVAIRACAWETNFPTMPDAISQTDSTYWDAVKPLYSYLKQTDTLSFPAWASFKSAFPDEVEKNTFELSFLQNDNMKTEKLPVLSRRVSSLSFDTLTFLWIQRLDVDSDCLNTDLLKFTNLGVLVLEKPFPTTRKERADDVVMRKWGTSVQETHSFTKLKVLALQNFDISVGALNGLAMFPALSLCDLAGRPIRASILDTYLQPEKWRFPQWAAMLNVSASVHEIDKIWAERRTTTHEKLRTVYDVATRLSQIAAVEERQVPRISIAYGKGVKYSNQHTNVYSNWFTRIPDSDEATEGDDREKKREKPQSNRQNKRRKMKTDKQKDLGDMLGMFGG